METLYEIYKIFRDKIKEKHTVSKAYKYFNTAERAETFMYAIHIAWDHELCINDILQARLFARAKLKNV